MSFGCTFISFKWANPQDTRRQISEQSTVSGQHSCPVAAERESEKRGGRRRTGERDNTNEEKKEVVKERNQGRRADVMIVWVPVMIVWVCVMIVWVSVSDAGVSPEACRDQVLWVTASVHHCCWETTGDPHCYTTASSAHTGYTQLQPTYNAQYTHFTYIQQWLVTGANLRTKPIWC